jgi:hypothetical protein
MSKELNTVENNIEVVEMVTPEINVVDELFLACVGGGEGIVCL